MPHQKPMKWPLPDIVHPDSSLCFQINVPNEPHHLAAFYGAIFLLSKPYAWGDDAAHTAIEVGKVWREIFDRLRPGGCSPVPPGFGSGIEEDFEMPLRVDCDCNVFITCCDGTEKQILTADQISDLLSQPGSGSEQPPPGGGCVQYHATLPGNSRWLLPTAVSTGDTIDVTGESGVLYDGASGLWYCPDGEIFFAGFCTGTFHSDGGAFMPAVPVGKIIANIGGTYYDVFPGPFTVPGGITNAQVEFVMNTSDLVNSGGSAQFDVQICNNQAAPFTHTFNVAINNGGWSVRDEGSYSPGTGFVDGTVFYSPNYFRGTDIQRLSFPARTITRVQWTCDFTAGAGVPDVGLSVSTPGVYAYNPTPVAGVHQYDTGIVSYPAVTDLFIDMICGQLNGSDPGGQAIITQIIVQGLGTDPF